MCVVFCGLVVCALHLQINSLDELLTTELIFDNVFAEMEPEEIAAILSTMLTKEKDDNEPFLNPTLEQVRVARVQSHSELFCYFL